MGCAASFTDWRKRPWWRERGLPDTARR